jgi:Family of unknown function (DUF5991)
MSNKEKLSLFTAVFFAVCVMFACAKNTSFNGVYVFDAELGGTVGGDSVVVSYELTVNDQRCEITIEGFQITEKLICKAQQSGALLKVYFRSYDTGAIENKYGVQVYKVDGLLLTLDKNAELTTIWGDLIPDEKFERMGKYFVIKR